MPTLGFNFHFKIAQTIYNKYHIFCTYSHTVEFPSSIMNLDNNLRKTWNVHFGNISLIVTKFDNGFHLNACAIVMKNKTRLKKKLYKKSNMVFIVNTAMTKTSKNCFSVSKLLIFRSNWKIPFPFYNISRIRETISYCVMKQMDPTLHTAMQKCN